jgi:RNA polymerase sigma factor (sigma-70 family)
MTDAAKWQLFLNSDKNALSEIFLSHYDDLFNYGMKLAANADVVEDAIQDLFLKLWKNRQRLNAIQIIKPYLFKSLRHHIQDSMALRKPLQSITEDIYSLFEISYSHEDFLIIEQVSEENRQKVIHALNQLAPRQREAIYLRYFEELDFEAIGQIMDMNVQSVRNSIHRGILVMRDLMILHTFFLMLGKSASAFGVQGLL